MPRPPKNSFWKLTAVWYARCSQGCRDTVPTDTHISCRARFARERSAQRTLAPVSRLRARSSSAFRRLMSLVSCCVSSDAILTHCAEVKVTHLGGALAQHGAAVFA